VQRSPARATRFATVAACVAAVAMAAPAVASAVDTTIRVEGSAATLVPEGAIGIEGIGTEEVWDNSFTPWPVHRGSAFWQLYRAASGSALNFEFKGFSFGLQVITVGPDVSAGSVGWQFKVNHVSPQVGADQTPLAAGDSVLWFFGGYAGARDLDVTPSADAVHRGTSFTVTVVSYDENGTPSPAAGASVAYGSATATADPQGRATFIAQGNGVQGVRASRAGDVRSATRAVCTYDADPAVCNVPGTPPEPATPPAPAPAPGASGLVADTVAPGSVITRPVLRSRRAKVTNIAGTAGPDRTDVAKVEVSLGLHVGTQCRFRTARGRFTTARPCSQPEWVTARTAGTRWILPLGKKKLPTGAWRVESRATDGAGNVETTRIPGANIGAFMVRGRVVTPISRITSPKASSRRTEVTRLRGTAGPAAADIQLVEVAVARRAGAKCRFLTRKDTFTGPRPCAKRVFLPADSRGSRWTVDPDEPLTAGRWIAWTRATSADDVRGRIRGVRFTVGGSAR